MRQHWCGGVGYSVIFDIDLDPVPAAVDRAFQQVAEAIAGISEVSPFFSSLDESVLQLDVDGFRFGYRVDQRHRLLRVIERSRIPRRL